MLSVLLNLLLFAGKFFAGKISGSVSVIADAFNNLTDAGTVCLSALGIKIAALGPGKRHPDGHGKFEWIIALITSLSVCLVGWELLRDSFKAIQNPADTVFSWLTLAILLASIGIKLFLYFYNSKKSKAQGFLSLKAVALDSLSDAISTSAVLLSLLLNCWFGWKMDGWFGIAVAILIIFNSLKSCSESIERLMGKAASDEDLAALQETVLSLCGGAVRIYDARIDDNGYGRRRASFSLMPNDGVAVESVIRLVPVVKEELKRRFAYETVIETEEPADKQTQDTAVVKLKTALDATGFPYELCEERLVQMPEGKAQFCACVSVPWWDDAEKKKLEELLSSPEAIGLTAQDSMAVRIRSIPAHGGYGSHGRGYRRGENHA